MKKKNIFYQYTCKCGFTVTTHTKKENPECPICKATKDIKETGIEYESAITSPCTGIKKASKGWEIPERELVECSLVAVSKVYITGRTHRKICALLEEYPNKEWIGYLVGRKDDEKKAYLAFDISIPPHEEAYVASAVAEPGHFPKDHIGIIHSHHTMGAFHSGTDKEFVDNNHPVSVVVSTKGEKVEYDAVTCGTTPCGKTCSMEAEVTIVNLKDKKMEEWLKEAKENIEKASSKVTYYPPRASALGTDDFACYYGM